MIQISKFIFRDKGENTLIYDYLCLNGLRDILMDVKDKYSVNSI